MTSETAFTNPYQAVDAPSASRRTRGIRWMIWTGAVALSLAILCLFAAFFWLMQPFQAIETASPATNASDLAFDISLALVPLVFAGLFMIVGIVLLILGFVLRQPVIEK